MNGREKKIVSNFLHQSGKSIEIFFDNMNYELTDTKKCFAIGMAAALSRQHLSFFRQQLQISSHSNVKLHAFR